MDDVTSLPLSDLALAIRARKVSSVEATGAFLDRIARLGPTLHAPGSPATKQNPTGAVGGGVREVGNECLHWRRSGAVDAVFGCRVDRSGVRFPSCT